MGKSRRINFPLPSPSQKKDKADIINSFGPFWKENKLTFAENNRAEISELLDEAAERAALIKQYLEYHQRGPVRFFEGNAREILWNLEDFPQDKKKFVHDLIVAMFSFEKTFSGRNLTKEELEKLVKESGEFMTRRNSSQTDAIQKLEKGIKDSWSETNQMLVEIFQKIDQNPLASPSYNNQLSKLSNSVQSMNQLVKKFYRSIQELKEKPEDASSDISETDSQMSEGIEDHPAQPDQNAQNVQPDEHPTVIPPATQDQPEEKDNQQGKIVVKQVADEIIHISEELKSLSSNLSSIKKDEISSNPDEAMKMVDSLHKRCISYSESLMKDLFKLDELSLSQEDRPKRKEQVLKIQQLTADIDSITQKLHDFVKDIKSEQERRQEEQKQKAPEQPKPVATEQPKRRDEEMDQDEYISKLAKRRQEEEEIEKAKMIREMELQKKIEEFERRLAEQAARLEPYLRRMKLRANLEVEEAADAYVISGHIPGLKTDDIEISSSRQGTANILNIKGFRGPSYKEMAVIRRQLARMGADDDDESFLRVCFGRFGTFAEKYAIPADADVKGVRADYNDGILTVIVPRIRSPPRLARPSLFENPEFWW